MKAFDKVIGYGSIKLELERIIDMMDNPDKYKALGVSIPSGVLLVGNPGVGKTLFAKCFIKASKWSVFTCRKNKPDGDFVKEIKGAFDEAKKNKPSIVFLDDMDKFANNDDRHINAEEFVTIQSCIDECKEKDVFVLATANDLRCLPDSLLRSGRFDKVLKVQNPRGKDAEEIIKHYLNKKKYVKDIDAGEIARILDGGSCADLESVINEAGVYAGFSNKSSIDMDDIVKACLQKIYKAPESLDIGNPEVIKMIAYHEAGHAVIAEVLEPNSVNLLSVNKKKDDIGGVTSYQLNEDYFQYKSFMENRVLSLMGGKVATEIVYGITDTGANSDLHRAYDIVDRFIDDYCSYGYSYWEERDCSQHIRERKDIAIRLELDKYYQQARKILIDNRAFLDALANALAEKFVLRGKEIREIKSSLKISA